MDKLANSITDFYIQKSYVPEDKREIYSYGFKLIIADIINFTIIMLLGAILGRFVESVVFLITLCSIRQFSGGFHAKTFWLCRTSMVITYLLVMAVTYILINFSDYDIRIIGTINALSLLLIAVLSPIKHPNKILTNQQKRQNKIKAILTTLILSTISIILVLLHRNDGVIISITLFAIVVLMIIGVIVQGRGKTDV